MSAQAVSDRGTRAGSRWRSFRLPPGTSLRGLASRKALALASWVLTTIAVASAVVGPHQGTSASSFVITQLRAEPRVNTGLSYTYVPPAHQKPRAATAAALTATREVSGGAYGPGHAMLWQPLPGRESSPHPLDPAAPTLLSAPGDCRHVALEGRCPRRPGEIAVEASNAFTYRWHLGSVVDPYDDGAPFRVVGIYQPRHNAGDFAFWFDSEQLRAVPGRLLTIPANNLNPITRPAPWFSTRSTIESRSDPWHVTVDQEASRCRRP